MAKLLGGLFRSVLGFVAELGIFQMELAIDSLREGMKMREFKREAAIAYDKTTAKVYDEDEKQKIREEYLEIINKIGGVGNPK